VYYAWGGEMLQQGGREWSDHRSEVVSDPYGMSIGN
jgi:hypothetical protein